MAVLKFKQLGMLPQLNLKDIVLYLYHIYIQVMAFVNSAAMNVVVHVSFLL